VASLVGDIISPLIGCIANTDLTALTFKIGDVDILYGAFLTAVINFIIMVFVIFLLVKAINKISSIGKKEEAPAEPTTKVCPYCQSEISIKAVKCPHCTSEVE